MYTGQNVYSSGARFRLAGMRTHYGARGLGACSDPWNIADAACLDASGGSGGGGLDWNSLLQTVLNDVTQIVKPGTPQLRPVYTPTSSAISSVGSSVGSAASSLGNNPLIWVGVAGLAYLILRKS